MSGAYAVLEGAPAIVSAVTRYVVADATRVASFVTPEVAAALRKYVARGAPWFDATALRSGDRKLGLGSSAAIVVASLAALEVEARGPLHDLELREAVFNAALDAHREAQPGGSGIDVASAVRGGTILASLNVCGLKVAPIHFPRGLYSSVWFSGHSASTQALLGRIRAFQSEKPYEARRLLDAQASAAMDAAQALLSDDTGRFLVAVGRQRECLDALGKSAQAPVVTDEVRHLDERARKEAGVVLPAGAGGGDVAIFFGTAPPSGDWVRAAQAMGHVPLTGVSLGARGVHVAPETRNSRREGESLPSP
ncbi:MAG TPA: hypothetical protein VKP30_14590, partial [Polyangiaceae bacterium]|nr:hypothetical protein [Polyangiaceae bacterium]